MGAFEEAYWPFPTFELELVSKAGEIPREEVDQRSGRAVGGLYAVREAAVVLLQVAVLCVGDMSICDVGIDGVGGSTYFVENLTSLSQTGKTGLKERYFFISARTKDMAQRLQVAFFFVHPEVRVGNWYILNNCRIN